MRPLHFILILLLLFFGGCQKKHSIKQNCSANIDTSDARATFIKVKSSGVNIDSFYNGLLSALDQQGRYRLILDHIGYYKTAAGNRKSAWALIFEMKGFAYTSFSKYDSSQFFFDMALNLFKRLKALKPIGECYAGKAMDYQCKDDLINSVAYDYKAIDILEQAGDSLYAYRLKMDVGMALARQYETRKALGMVNSCLRYFQAHANLFMVAYAESNLSSILYYNREYDKALEYARKALRIGRQSNNKEIIGRNLNDLGLDYIALKQWDSATIVLKENLEQAEEMKDIKNILHIKIALAECLMAEHRPEAEKLMNAIIDTGRRTGALNIVALAYFDLSEMYHHAKKKDDTKALSYYVRYREIQDTILNAKEEQTVNELNIKYETSKKEEQISRLNDEKKIDNIKKLAYLLLFACTAIIAVLTILFLTNRNRKNKLIIEKTASELLHNKKELQQFTDSIRDKNKRIEELEQKLFVEVERPVSLDENNEQLSELYQLKILTEDDWREFKILFDKVHPGYISRLRQKYPGLTAGEERQFLLTKLNIDPRECADMLGISVQSVKKNRYRLKKRFNLSEQEDLDEFVKSFI